jgi:predicted transcriptional regulator
MSNESKPNNSNLIQKLQEIGLSEPESKLYLTGLKLGPTTILQLSKTSEIKRTTVYTMIENLIKKGIFEIQIDGWKKLYTASSPQNLQNLIYKNYQDLLTIIPTLESINNQTPQEIYLKSHNTIESIKLLYNKIIHNLQPNTQYLIIGNMNLWAKAMGYFCEGFFVEREKACKSKNILIKALFIQDEYANLQKKRQQLLGMEVRFLPKSANIKTNYVITSNIAVFHQTVESNTAIETNNPYIIETQRELFELLWNT